jgi:regulator of replication initiation timing
MVKAWKVCATLLILALACSTTYLSTLNLQISTALTHTEEEKSLLKAENEALRGELSSLNQNFTSLSEAYSSLNESYIRLSQEHSALKISYNALEGAYVQLNSSYSNLLNAYSTLNSTYGELLTRYSNLNATYNELLKQYSALNASYSQLLSLNSSYAKLYSALYEPLTNKTVPTTEELKAWLREDPTDTIAYNMPNFVCGDYAVMLAFHAKLMGWDMGVVAVLGRKADGSEFNHAFNAIICREGLVYVEPQTDEVWWYSGHSEIQPGGWYKYPGFGQVYVEEYIIVVLYDQGG